MRLTTTLNLLRAHSPCDSGSRKLLKALGKKTADDEPLGFEEILKSNGLDDALWCLRAVIPEHEKDRDRLARLFAADCAESCLAHYETKYPGDLRPRQAIEAARKFAAGEISEESRSAARSAAWSAARSAAESAAWSAAWSAIAEKYLEYFCR